SAVFPGRRDRPAWRGSTACRRWWPRSAPSPCPPIQFCGWSPRSGLWPEEMADQHADDDGKRVSHTWEAPHPHPHTVADRVVARAQCQRLLEHQEKCDQRGRRSDDGQERFRGEGHFMPSGDVRPCTGRSPKNDPFQPLNGKKAKGWAIGTLMPAIPASTLSRNSRPARPDWVKIVAMFPRADAFACAIASSRVAARAIESTGPNISSRPTDICEVTRS